MSLGEATSPSRCKAALMVIGGRFEPNRKGHLLWVEWRLLAKLLERKQKARNKKQNRIASWNLISPELACTWVAQLRRSLGERIATLDTFPFVVVVADAGDMVSEVSIAVETVIDVTTAAQPCDPLSERRSAQNTSCHLSHSSFRLTLVVAPNLHFKSFSRSQMLLNNRQGQLVFL